jgi:UDP-sugar transporter A1/2/3
LDAATFQVTYQLKILTTAICAVIMLGKELSRRQWLALLLLTVGVALVQLPKNLSTTPTVIEQSADPSIPSIQSDQFMGLVAVLIACFLSGLAGVYFEKILKRPPSTTLLYRPPPSIWERNIQLGLFSVILCAVFGVIIKDGEAVRQHGFFQGYSTFALLTILCQALGGLLVALVVKYADNILKGFATSISIVLSCFVSVFLFDFMVSWTFLVGAGLVILSTFLYEQPMKVERTVPNLSPRHFRLSNIIVRSSR